MDSLLTEETVAELERELAPLKADLIRGEHLAVAHAQLRQERVNQAQARIETAAVEGLGELQCRVDPKIFINLGMRFGFECWNDQGFLDSFLKKNEGMRVRNRSRKTTVRVGGEHTKFMGMNRGVAGRGTGHSSSLIVLP